MSARGGKQLQPLRCGSCGAPVPLAEAEHVHCPHCGSEVALPPGYLEAMRLHRETAAARRAAEPVWQALARPRSGGLSALAMLLVVFLPPLATLLANLVPYPPLSKMAIMAFVTLPAVLPGAGLYIWTLAVDATAVGLRNQLSAKPPPRGGGSPTCRNCGAPLEVEADAVAASCAYCGTDSLVVGIGEAELAGGLRAAVRTLGEAVRRLRVRRVLLGLGIAGVVAALGGASMLVWIAARASF